MSNQTLSLRIKSVTWEVPGILSYDLRDPQGEPLPAFTAGAHLDVYLPNSLVRSYSLLNAQDERHRYVIAVQRDRASRGGSVTVHERFHAGDLVQVSAPRNNFALAEDAPQSVLFAGGIGITPILSMVRRLAAVERPWTLYYCARTQQAAAFLGELADLAASSGGTLHTNFDEEPGGKMLDLAGVIAQVPSGAHLYCCGPTPMLEAFEAACAGISADHVHVEYFKAKEQAATGGGFTVVLTRSQREIAVAPGQTILDAVNDAGIDASYSCREGVCGSCETKVIEGVPEHRDLILTDAERAANKTMMICCSGSKTARLVLDL